MDCDFMLNNFFLDIMTAAMVEFTGIFPTINNICSTNLCDIGLNLKKFNCITLYLHVYNFQVSFHSCLCIYRLLGLKLIKMFSFKLY